MPNRQHPLTYGECQALKGLAILGIVLHNFCHYLPHAALENEFSFSQARTLQFFHLLSNVTHAPVNVFSFLGHYGVPIFLFCTGYGLVMKYEQSDSLVPVPRFLFSHYCKLLWLMLPGLVITLSAIALYAHKFLVTWSGFLLQATLLINFHPDAVTIIKPGPYWYFGFVMQIYLFYRLLIYRRHWCWIIFWIVVCWLVQVLQQPDGSMLEWIRHNFVMGILPLSMGVVCGRQVKTISLSAMVWVMIALVSLCGVVAFNLHFQLWLWCPVLVIAGAVAFVKCLGQRVIRPFHFLGTLSSALFVMHPLARVFTVYHAQTANPYVWLLIYLILSLALALLYRLLLKRMPHNCNIV